MTRQRIGSIPFISLWQPWATLIALGAKGYETRDWRPPGWLVGRWFGIHGTVKLVRQVLDDEPFRTVLAHHGITSGNAVGRAGYLPQRAIVAVVRFDYIFHTEEVLGRITEQEKAFGNYSPGRLAWRVADRINLNDYPLQYVRGTQRLGYLDQDLFEPLKTRILAAGHTVPADLLG